jgi:hypothetical protein
MDLYEALKSGASEDELYDSFKREVAKAQKRITEETAQIAKEKVQQEKLAAARKNAVDAIYSYLDLFFKPYVGETKKEIAPKSTILAALVDWEKDYLSILENFERIKTAFSTKTTAKKDAPLSTKSQKTTFFNSMEEKDKDIILDFLKSF